VVDPWLCCGSCAYENTDKAIMAKMNSGLMIDFMGMLLFMFQLAKIIIFSLTATFPADFKRIAYFCKLNN
jgi:hypothetical protein